MSFFLICCNLLLLGSSTALVYFHTKLDWEGKFWLPYIAVKWMAGIGATWVYLHWYNGGDLISYIHDANIYSCLSFKQLLQQLFAREILPDLLPHLHFTVDKRAILMSKIVAIFYYPSKNIWLTAITISHVSAIVSFYFLRKIIQRLPSFKWSAVLAFLWLPSTLFWSSGIFKESITYPMILLTIMPFFIQKGATTVKKYAYFLVALSALILLWLLKYYVAVILAPVLLSTWLVLKNKQVFGQWRPFRRPFWRPFWRPFRRPFRRPTLWLASFVLLLLVGTQLHPNLYLHRFIGVLIENHQLMVELSRPESVLYFPYLESSLISVLLHFPIASFYGIFRPLVGERTDLLPLLASLENSLLFLLTISLIGFLIFKKKFLKLSFWVFPVVVYVLLMAGLLTLATPNLGTLARYKIAYWPFFAFIIFAGWQQYVLPEVQKHLPIFRQHS